MQQNPLLRSSLAALPFAAGALPLLGCNAVTGINGLTYETQVAADGVTIQDIAIYQGIKRSLMNNDPSDGGVVLPIIAGRDALVRVFVQTDETYNGGEVIAHLYLGGDKTPMDTSGIVWPGDESQLMSTINFQVPGEKIVGGLEFRVELTQSSMSSSGTNQGARYPESGTAPVEVQTAVVKLKVVIVPVQYGADGSNRLPDTSEEQIKGYRDWFYGTYPVPDVEVTVREPWPYKKAISANGAGWSEVLDALANLRESDGVAGDVYYYGAFEPKQTFGAYCAGGCVAGLGMLGSAADTYSHAVVGLGYTGYNAWSTAIHETGHAHGRHHAPCGGPDNVDKNYPYKNAAIGVWGYNPTTQKLIAPDQAVDIMSYCDPYWASDYTFKGLFEDRANLMASALIVPVELRDLTWERARLDGEGQLTWIDPVKLRRPPIGRATEVTVLEGGGERVVTGHFFAYDHLPGGVLLWPQSSAPVAGIEVTLAGSAATIARPSHLDPAAP